MSIAGLARAGGLMLLKADAPRWWCGSHADTVLAVPENGNRSRIQFFAFSGTRKNT
jgi:hypothetical protein